MKHKSSQKMKLLKRSLVVLGIIGLVVLGFLVSMAWLESQNEKAVEEISDMKNISRVEKDDKKQLEGRNETVVPENVLDAYTVAADKPRALYVDKLGIAARTLPMGKNSDGSMQAPLGIYDAGWYAKSAVP